MSYAYGWKQENESLHDLTVYRHSVICSVGSDVPVPDVLDLPDWMQDDQLSWPFCHAHMRTGISEILAGLAMNDGTFPKYSRYFAAITDMKMDGNDSRPEGASIGGSLKAAIRWGDAAEELMPYPDPERVRYSNRISDAVFANAAAHKIKSLSPLITSYDQMISMAKSQRYVFGIGIPWTTGLANLQGVSDNDGRATSGGVLGGHALLSFGWKKIKGDLWPFLHNSHNGWGIKRRVAMSPKWWDSILKNNYFGVWGVSDIELTDFTPKPRKYDFKSKGIML